MRIRIIWVGRTREVWVAEGVEKFSKLIRPFASLAIEEVRQSDAKPQAAAIGKEGLDILRRAPGGFVLMDERGTECDSPGFAGMLKDRASVDFVIGGPHGVSDQVRAAARETVSLSRMTFTHDMARVFLMEQIYRGFTINAGRGYHH